MKRVVIVAPDESFANTVRRIMNNNPLFNCHIIQGSLEQGVELCRQEAGLETQVIISRGLTAVLLREAFPKINVINVRVTQIDILKAIYEARKYGDKVAVAGLFDSAEAFLSIKDILDKIMNIEIKYISTMPNIDIVEKDIFSAAKEGYSVFIGGPLLYKTAERLGFRGVLVTSGEDAILQSLREAHNLLEALDKDKERANLLDSVLTSIQDGILAIDRQGLITMFNRSAVLMMGLIPGNIMGEKIENVIPELNILEVMKTGKPNQGRVIKIGKKNLVSNEIPVYVENKIVGAIASFQEIGNLQNLEYNVRRAILSKGHTARTTFTQIIGNSAVIKKTTDLAKEYAKSNGTVLITGETGTGKEVFAQSIHMASLRSEKPFVGVNSAAIPETLLESELFGYVEGAFTGAKKGGKMGLFEQAHGGTLFLDEISEMPLFLQARLLRALQEKEIMRIGDNKIIPIDIRVIAATNRNLKAMVETGKFREDLYYRLNVLPLKIPSLRERKEDIPLLLNYFLTRHKNMNWKIEDQAIDFLMDLEWPGNIRQIENLAERIAAVIKNGNITYKRLISLIDDDVTQKSLRINEASLEDMQRNIRFKKVMYTLKETGGNKAEAAKRLGITTTTLWRWLKEARNENILE